MTFAVRGQVPGRPAVSYYRWFTIQGVTKP